MVKIFLISLIVSLGIGWASVGHSEEQHQKKVLTFGRSTGDVFHERKKLEPFIVALASKLQDVGIVKGEAVVIGDNELSTVIQTVKAGKLDIVFESFFPSVVVAKKAEMVPLLELQRKKPKTSLIFVHKESGIRQVEDLKGKIIAFEDSGSSSGYYFPKLVIENMGLKLTEVSVSSASVPQNQVGYIFAGAELNVSSWVFSKKVNAGAMSNSEWSKSKYVPKAYKKTLHILLETQKIPDRLILVRRDLNPILISRIKEELMKIHQTEPGRTILKKWKKINFTEIPETTLKMMEEIPSSVFEQY